MTEWCKTKWNSKEFFSFVAQYALHGETAEEIEMYSLKAKKHFEQNHPNLRLLYQQGPCWLDEETGRIYTAYAIKWDKVDEFILDNPEIEDISLYMGTADKLRFGVYPPCSRSMTEKK